MKFVYLLPFSYFFNTRLRTGSIEFHLIFEWLAAAILVLVVGEVGPVKALLAALMSYLAFISLYEIGYVVNDVFSSRAEIIGRQRGSHEANVKWVAAWIAARLAVFLFVTIFAGNVRDLEWWSFFTALFAVFTLHNYLSDSELKSITFLWLAWLRFMAPLIFVVAESQRMGIGLAAAMAYVAFRLFGYLDSKGLLRMPGRQRPGFRVLFFIMPLIGALVLWPYESAKGFLVLVAYYALAAILGTAAGSLIPNTNDQSNK